MMKPLPSKHKVLQEGTRKHAKRKNPAEWKAYRHIICNKYKEEPLKDVMAFMETEHQFTATKRQYVHQLKNWGAIKYNKQSALIERPFEVESKTHVGRATQTHRRGESSSSLEISDMERKPRSRTLSNHNSNDTGEDEEMPEFPQSQWWSGPYQESGRNRPQLQFRHENFSLSLEKKRSAADIFFAMSFDKPAFRLYEQCYKLLEQVPDSSLMTMQSSLVIAMARSAQIPEHIETVRQILTTHLPGTGVESRAPMLFLCHMLEAYMFDRDKDRVSAKASIEETLNRFFVDKKIVLWPPEHGLGIIPYLFLLYGIQRYNEGREGQDCLDKQSILDNFLSQLERNFQADYSLDKIIYGCVLWCIRILERYQEIPQAWQDIPCEHEDLRGWKDDYELFCYLWHEWQTERSARAVQPPWVDRAEQHLGISATEVLVTISWLIMDYVTEDDDDDAAPLAGTHHCRLVNRALRNAQLLLNIGSGGLWRRFLDKFDWMNTLVDTAPKDKDFKATALPHIREYVAHTLRLDLHAVGCDSTDSFDQTPSYSARALGKQPLVDNSYTVAEASYGPHSQFHMDMMSAQKTMSPVQLDLR